MKIKQYILYIYNWIYEKKIKISDKILKRKIGVPQILTIDETIDILLKIIYLLVGMEMAK